MTTSTRRWFQFSLRTLLALTLVSSCFLAWVAAERARSADQRAAWQLIVNKGGMTNFAPKPTRPPWLSWLLGEDVNCEGDCVEFGSSRLTDEDVATLTIFRRVSRLSLNHNPVTDRGIAHLRKLTELKYLSLDETKITDAGLDSLHDCRKLELVTLDRTRTTTAGVERLREALPNVVVIDADMKEWPARNGSP